MSYFRNNLSNSAILLSVLIIAYIIYNSKIWEQEKQVIYWDVISYYAYLPAEFIFDDIKLEKQETLQKGLFWPEKLPNGGNVIKTSMGLSVLFSPFFFAGHAAAKILGYEAYGYSVPYKIALLIGALVYLIIGLIFLKKILKEFYNEKITALTILAIALGTNLTFYASKEATMTHLYSFTLFSIFIWGTIRWHKNPQFITLMLLGALSGLISLIRPTNALILVFFFLYDITSWASLKTKFLFFVKHLHWLLFMFLAFLAVWVPQFLYWKLVSGSYFYYSYTNEHFFFDNPQILNGLFSYRKGWFIYTPLMFLAVIGIPFLFKQKRVFSWAVFVFVVLNIYIIFSWWCWWYGGGYSIRALVDSYVIMALPLAALLDAAGRRRKIGFTLVAGLMLVLIIHNNFQIKQYRYGTINFDGMTKEAYWYSFGKIHPGSDFWPLLKTPDYEKAKLGIVEYP